MSSTYEIEIKSLLGSKEKADELKQNISRLDPSVQLLNMNKQLNHYFVGGSLHDLFAAAAVHIDPAHLDQFNAVVEHGKTPSVRTRQTNDRVLLIVKASIDDTTSSNGTARLEFESQTPHLSLTELDALVRRAGYEYQAKWSREREEYSFRDLALCIDKNAGYGYIAEFEKVVDNPEHAGVTKDRIRLAMAELGVEELSQDRLERMFAYYNEHWPKYYGTDNIFTVV